MAPLCEACALFFQKLISLVHLDLHALFSLLVAGLSLAAVPSVVITAAPSTCTGSSTVWSTETSTSTTTLTSTEWSTITLTYGHRYSDVHRDRFGHHYLNVHSLVNRDDDVKPNHDVIGPDQYEYFQVDIYGFVRHDDPYHHYNTNHDLIDLDQYEYFDIYGFVRHDDHYHHYKTNQDLIDLDQYDYFNEHLQPCLCADHNLMDVPRMLSRQRQRPDPQWVRRDLQHKQCGELPDYLFKTWIYLRRCRGRGSPSASAPHPSDPAEPTKARPTAKLPAAAALAPVEV
ncbi:hypothetical protein BDZ89DRAFT_1038910 [Hymenopellis radicata]|nr:hypothetical protein BDZ89DRAFT_1038910 [Hymenopellis radicata]